MAIADSGGADIAAALSRSHERRCASVSPVAWVAVALAVVCALVSMTGLLQRFDDLLYDQLSGAARPAPSTALAIVEIDERSLRELGRWPWRRSIHAQLIDRLIEQQVRAIGMQVIFAEPGDPRDDTALAAAIGRAGRVVLPVYPEVDTDQGGLRAAQPVTAIAASARLGHVDTELNADGVVRDVFLHAGIETAQWPHFSVGVLQAAGVALPATWQPAAAPLIDHGAWVRAQRMRIPFAGAPGFTRVSFIDVLRGTPAAAVLRGRIVLVGATAAGLGDVFVTPRVGAKMSGVELNAHVANGALVGRLTKVASPTSTALLTALLVALPFGVYPRVAAAWVPAVGLLALALLIGIAAFFLREGRQWFELGAAAVGIALSYPAWSWVQLRRDARDLAEQREHLSATLGSIGDAVVATDGGGRITFMNPAAERLTSVAQSKAHGRRLDQVCDLRDELGNPRFPATELFEHAFQGTLAAGQRARLNVDGAPPREVRFCGQPIRDSRGAVRGGVLAITDVTDLVTMAAHIEFQAAHDALTGLPNRTLLRDRLVQALVRARRQNRYVAVAFVDIDRFKRINDHLGHSAGDVVLQKIAARLRETIREGDTVARWGGDEFIVVLDDLPGRDAAETVVDKLVAALRAPLSAGTASIIPTASIGCAFYPTDGTDIETLLRNADAAMYAAKGAGRDAARFFAAVDDRGNRELQHAEQDLRDALDQAQFELHYQPQVALRSGRVIGAEAFVRWRHPSRGLLRAEQFLPAAAGCGLLHEISQWALADAFRQINRWRGAGLPRLQIGLNVAPEEFFHPHFEAAVDAALAAARADADQLKFEVAERVLVEDLDRSLKMFDRLRQRGFQLSIGEFGVGYSSLRHLKQFPVTELKIDRMFVRGVADSAEDASIAESVIALARSMRLNAVAEGVETIEQLVSLRERDCPTAQGFLLSPPLLPAEFAQFVVRGNSLPIATRPETV